MANSRSALKRIRTAERNRLRNKSYKSVVKTLTKKYIAAVETYAADNSPENLESAKLAQAAAYSKIDKAVKVGAFHANTGARKKSNLARLWKRQAPLLSGAQA
ncbi:MAG: 30S ribosomal protein S20 [Cyanobacteria bacterium P01_H01_bin.15]